MGDRSRAPLIALAASIGLVGVYLAFGGGSYTPAATADPCQTRDQAVLDERGIFEGIALSALDGAACQLHVSREELTLALADEQATEEFAAAHGCTRAPSLAALAGRAECLVTMLPDHFVVREAVLGDDLIRLEDEVLKTFREKAAEERSARAGSTRLQLAAVRRIFEYLRPERGARRGPPMGLAARRPRG